MIKIDHLAIWCGDLEKLKDFYINYFSATAGEKYFNPVKKFESYFLTFSEGCRLELMRKPDIPDSKNDIIRQFRGLIHFAITLGSKEAVDALTNTLRGDGYTIVGEPRTTGDGYYEAVVLDPEGNRVEITA
jgi:lactoylglutathione lyase